jgi:chromosome segregation ATPase
MKYLIFLISFLLASNANFAQRKQPAKPATAAAAPKPKGASPYVMKKDFDSSMTKIDNRISNLQGSVSSIKSGINSKDAQITSLSEQMLKVEEVLNSTNFKISLTSDSLNKTQLSLEEIQKENINRFNNLEAQISSLKSTINFIWITLIIALIIPIAVWFLMKKQIVALEKSLQQNQKIIQASLDEQSASIKTQSDNLDRQIRLETRNVQTYADQLNLALKNELGIQKNEINKTNNTLVLISNDITDIQKKLDNTPDNENNTLNDQPIPPIEG